jgi:Holliday junction resolvase-like predicted endonuclease
LTVGQPGDRFEIEADRAASRVMEGQSGTLAAPAAAAPGLQMKPSGSGADVVASGVGQALSASGQVLDAATRGYFEPRYGHDFGKVRVHSDDRASQSAISLGARAYTVGNHLVFAQGQYAPHTSGGRQLIAHELAHVVQQDGGNPQAGLAGTAPRLQRQLFVPPIQSGGFQRGIDKDIQYGRQHDPEEQARRKAAIARERAIADALKPFKDAFLGEFEEDPSTAGILIDTGLGLIPVVDQGLDLRDIIAHIFMMSERGQHKSPGRWLGLALTLIGVVPEIGSAVKGAAKLLIRKGGKVAAQLAVYLARAVKTSADLPNLAARFRRLLAEHWSSWVSGGKRAFASAVGQIESYLQAVGATELLNRVRAVRDMAAKMLDDAFERLRRQIEDAIDDISPQMVPAGGPQGKVRLPESPKKPASLHTSGSGTGASPASKTSGAPPAPSGAYPTTPNLARGNLGEKLATDALAAKGHKIISFKPSILGTNQGGIDMVTMHKGVVYLVDNKAISSSGNVSSVSSLTNNFVKNLKATTDEIANAAADASRGADEIATLREALSALRSGKYARVVTNANIARDSAIKSDVTDKLKKMGISFIDVMR